MNRTTKPSKTSCGRVEWDKLQHRERLDLPRMTSSTWVTGRLATCPTGWFPVLRIWKRGDDLGVVEMVTPAFNSCGEDVPYGSGLPGPERLNGPVPSALPAFGVAARWMNLRLLSGEQCRSCACSRRPRRAFGGQSGRLARVDIHCDTKQICIRGSAAIGGVRRRADRMIPLVSPIQGDVAFVAIDSPGVAQGWIDCGLSDQRNSIALGPLPVLQRQFGDSAEFLK